MNLGNIPVLRSERVDIFMLIDVQYISCDLFYRICVGRLA